MSQAKTDLINVSMRLPGTLWRKVRLRSLKDSRPAQELVADALWLWLAK